MAAMGDEGTGGKGAAPRVRAWDLPTRLFHWLLALLILTAYLTRKNTGDLAWHKWTGYAILVLVVFRILWGFAGSSTSRFSSFLYGPIAALRYGLDFLLRRRGDSFGRLFLANDRRRVLVIRRPAVDTLDEQRRLVAYIDLLRCREVDAALQRHGRGQSGA